jgi:hypothetical protein
MKACACRSSARRRVPGGASRSSSCRAAMGPDARLLIVDRMLPERATPDDLHPLLVDILMMVSTGGRERTEREFRALLAAAGLELLSVSEALPPSDYRVIEAGVA